MEYVHVVFTLSPVCSFYRTNNEILFSPAEVDEARPTDETHAEHFGPRAISGLEAPRAWPICMAKGTCLNRILESGVTTDTPQVHLCLSSPYLQPVLFMFRT